VQELSERQVIALITWRIRRRSLRITGIGSPGCHAVWTTGCSTMRGRWWTCRD